MIIEDERLSAQRLSELILEVDPDAEIAGVAESVKSTVKWLSSNPNPDLIFMDIQLGDGLCFEIFDKARVDSPVIFTTAYNEYALQAFKVNSIDYLLKPVDKGELANAIEKFRKLNNSRNTETIRPETLQKVMEMLKNPYKSRFMIRIGEHIKTISTDDIAFFHSTDKYTFVRLSGGRDFSLDFSLDQLTTEIDPAKFFRVSRKYLVAMQYINDIIAYSGSRLKLVVKGGDTEEILVSREKVSEFKKWLEG